MFTQMTIGTRIDLLYMIPFIQSIHTCTTKTIKNSKHKNEIHKTSDASTCICLIYKNNS